MQFTEASLKQAATELNEEITETPRFWIPDQVAPPF